MLGQKLVFGFHGKTLPEEFKNLLREYKIGNVILFLRNVESAEQLRALCAEIQSLVQEETGYPAFIIIDQEGGMVTRLPQDAVNVPGAMALAAWRREAHPWRLTALFFLLAGGLGGLVLALGLEHSRQATAAQSAVTEMTNELLKKNADTLKMGTIATAKEAERSIVDIETLQHTNQQLIESLDEVARIQQEGAAKRREAEAQLGRIEGELKQKLLELRG